MQDYVESGFCEEALNFVEHLQMEGFIPVVVTYLSSLRACSNMGIWDEGQDLHLEFVKDEYERHLFLGNALIDMYAKCGSLTLAWVVFEDLPSQDVMSWNTLIGGYAKYGPIEDTLCLLVVRTNGNDGIPS